MTDIEITRKGGKWEVHVDGTAVSFHNEAKEGYENLVEQKINNPDKSVVLVPNFTVEAGITQTGTEPEDTFDLSDLEIENYVKQLPVFEPGNTYTYVLFEMDNNGIKNIRPSKTVDV